MKQKFRQKLHYCWWNFNRLLAVTFFWTINRVKVLDKQNVPQKGPLIILSNHQSFIDPMLCQGYLKRPIHFVARSSLWNNPVMSWLLDSYYTIPIKRESADLSGLKNIIRKLKENAAILMYPEATRTEDGRIRNFKMGFSLVCRKTKPMILPMVIEGADKAWPKNKKLFSCGKKIMVRYGQPISSQILTQMSDEQFAEHIVKIMRDMQNDLRKKMGNEPYEYTEQKNENVEVP